MPCMQAAQHAEALKATKKKSKGMEIQTNLHGEFSIKRDQDPVLSNTDTDGKTMVLSVSAVKATTAI